MGQESQAHSEVFAPSEQMILALVLGQSPSVEVIVENLKGRGTAQAKQQHQQQIKAVGILVGRTCTGGRCTGDSFSMWHAA